MFNNLKLWIYPSVAIDINSINSIKMGGKIVKAIDIFKIFKKGRVLLYNSKTGDKPTVISGGFLSFLFPIRVIDVNKLSKKQLDKITDKINKS